jgi:hypothetical protein
MSLGTVFRNTSDTARRSNSFFLTVQFGRQKLMIDAARESVSKG